MKHCINPFLMTVMLTMGVGTSAVAQSYFDDDIYYNASKSKSTAATSSSASSSTSSVALPGSDAYVVATDNTRNIDEYNRRGNYKPVTSSATVDSLGENFTYTKRLERFYNSDVVSGSDDADLQYYYNYADDEFADVNNASPTTINIYVDNADPWDTYWNPYYYASAWSWATAPVYHNPWWRWNYAWGYGPSWSWSWGFTPSWSLNWGWDGWGLNWGISWGWSPTWGWNPPHRPIAHGWNTGRRNDWAARPGRANQGSWRGTARPTGNATGLASRPSKRGMAGVATTPGRGNSTRPSASANSGRATSRPGAAGVRPSTSTSGRTNSVRPSATANSVRPSSAASTGRDVAGSYGGGSYNPSNATRPSGASTSLRGNGSNSNNSSRGNAVTPSRSTNTRSSGGNSSTQPSRSNSGNSSRSSLGGSSSGSSRGSGNGGGSRNSGGGGGSRGGRH